MSESGLLDHIKQCIDMAAKQNLRLEMTLTAMSDDETPSTKDLAMAQTSMPLQDPINIDAKRRKHRSPASAQHKPWRALVDLDDNDVRAAVQAVVAEAPTGKRGEATRQAIRLGVHIDTFQRNEILDNSLLSRWTSAKDKRILRDAIEAYKAKHKFIKDKSA